MSPDPFVDIGANLTDLQGEYHGKVKHSSDLEVVLQRAKLHGVDKIILTAGCLSDTKEALEICKKFDPDGQFLFTTIGVHPTRCTELEENSSEYLGQMIKLGQDNKDRIVALGEMGVDSDRTHFCAKETQIKYFKAQLLSLVPSLSLPLFLHLRNASDKFFECVRSVQNEIGPFKGVVHSFDGTRDEMESILEMGFDIGINGCSLKTQQNLDIVAKIPIDRIHLESDAPWCNLKPTHASWKFIDTKFESTKPEKWSMDKHIKGRNEPCNIVQVSQVVSKLQKSTNYHLFTSQ